MKIKSVANMPETTCLNCGVVFNRAGGLNHDKKLPVNGDVSICLYCAHIAIFDSRKGGLRPLTGPEMVQIAGMEKLIQVVNEIVAKQRTSTVRH